MSPIGLHATYPGHLLIRGASPLNASSFLNAIQPNPTRGTIDMALPHSGDQMAVTGVTQDVIDQVETTVKNVVRGAQDIQEALSRWGLSLPHPLSTTGGLWTLHPKRLPKRMDEFQDAGC